MYYGFVSFCLYSLLYCICLAFSFLYPILGTLYSVLYSLFYFIHSLFPVMSVAFCIRVHYTVYCITYHICFTFLFKFLYVSVHQGSKLSLSTQHLKCGCTQFGTLVHSELYCSVLVLLSANVKIFSISCMGRFSEKWFLCFHGPAKQVWWNVAVCCPVSAFKKKCKYFYLQRFWDNYYYYYSPWPLILKVVCWW